MLLGLAAGAEYFHAPDGNAFATMPVDEAHRETAAVRSKVFRNWLSRAYYLETGKAPSAKSLLDAIGVLEARARYDGKSLPVYHRVGGVGGECCLDLCSPCRRSVVIDKDGWRLTHEAPVRLRRPPTARPLPEPVCGGSLDELRPFINIRGEDWPLVVGWLVQALRLTGPYLILCLHGEQGSAKSTAARALRGLRLQKLPESFAVPTGKLPLAAGRVTFLRRVSAGGTVTVLSQSYRVGKRHRGPLPTAGDGYRARVADSVPQRPRPEALALQAAERLTDT